MANESDADGGIQIIPKGYQASTEQRGYSPTAARPGPPPTGNTAVVTPAALAPAVRLARAPNPTQERGVQSGPAFCQRVSGPRPSVRLPS
jgi:hypothetical protein